MKIKVLSYMLLFLLLYACGSEGKKEQIKYEETWESLAKHNEEPAWFQDAKLGIYFHWGVYSVPAFGSEWYPRWMHFEGSDEYQHHLANYGEPSKFG